MSPPPPSPGPLPGRHRRAALLLEALLADEVPVRLEVDGHSMSPFIRRGDSVTLRPLRDQRPPLGAVLAVAIDRRFVVHRVVGWADRRVVTRGDCAAEPDPASPLERVLGVVTRVERHGRRTWAGLGPERRAIAWLSRSGALRRLARLRECVWRAAISRTAEL